LSVLSGEKKDYKQIFQRKINKVTNMLQICKPKNDKVIEPKLTDQEIEEMFCGIEESCDSIINEKTHYLDTDNVRLHFDSIYNNLDQTFIPIDYEEQQIINDEIYTKNLENKSRFIMDEKIEEQIVEQEQIEEQAKQEYPKCQEEFEEKSIEELKTEEIHVQPPEPDKKKRKYNKKKK
jgi:hypothetical protein